jgi:hypothetical protein
MSISFLFNLVGKSQIIHNYFLANLGFACLMNEKFANKKELKIIHESNDEDDYYDLFVISDGIREVKIPLPLIKNHNKLVEYCGSNNNSRWRRDNQEISIKNMEELSNLSIDNLIVQIKKDFDKLLELYPNCQRYARKYLADKDCTVCPYFAREYNKGAIHCSVHPFGYPERGLCGDWDILIDRAEVEYRLNTVKSCWHQFKVNDALSGAYYLKKRKEEQEMKARYARERAYREAIDEQFETLPLCKNLQMAIDNIDNIKQWGFSSLYTNWNRSPSINSVLSDFEWNPTSTHWHKYADGKVVTIKKGADIFPLIVKERWYNQPSDYQLEPNSVWLHISQYLYCKITFNGEKEELEKELRKRLKMVFWFERHRSVEYAEKVLIGFVEPNKI